MLITSYKPDGEGHKHDISTLIRGVLFRKLSIPPSPVEKSVQCIQEFYKEYEKKFEEKIISSLKDYTVEQLMNLDFEIINLDPVIGYEEISKNKTVIRITYKDVNVSVSKREKPRTIEDAQDLYNLIHERR